MRLIGTLGVVLGIAACGGETGEAPLFGELESGVTIDATDVGWHYGLANGAGNPRCTATNASGCAIPLNRTVTYKIDPTGLTSGQLSDWQAQFDGSLSRLADDYPDWTLSRTTGDGEINIRLSDDILATNKNSIHTYVWANPNTQTLINDFGRVGKWFHYGSATCSIDRTNIVRDFTVSQQAKVLAHAMDYCFHIGVGIGSGGAPSRPHAIAVTPNAFKSNAPSPRVKCLTSAAAEDLSGSDLVVSADFGLDQCSGLSDS